MFRETKKIHFVGIGGIGMSGIAEVLINLGYLVSGSDLAQSETTDHLVKIGASISIGHDPALVADVDVVVVSSAISEKNIEVARALENHIPVIPRAEMLAELMRLKHGIAIAGTHGKTTTTSMIATILAHAGLDPTVVIGGRLNSLGSGAKLGEGELMVAEADESDGSFLKLSPTIGVVTTIDKEHMDYYGDIDTLLDAFLTFINNIPFYGASILCLDQPYIQSLIPKIKKKYITYGLTTQAGYVGKSIKRDGLKTTFTVYRDEQLLGDIDITMPGKHNVLNALASVAVAMELDVAFEKIQEGLKIFSGVQRRFQIVGKKKGITVIDDYGHHPAEIYSTLKTARELWEKRKIYAIFQPHRYSRTKDLMEEFCTVFYDADVVIITDIFAAGEEPICGVTAEGISDGIKKHGHKEVHYFATPDAILKFLLTQVREDDIVFTLGAGNIWKTGKLFFEKLTG